MVKYNCGDSVSEFRKRRAKRLGLDRTDSVEEFRKRRENRLKKRFNADNFIGLVYGTLNAEGIDTKGMDKDEAIKKFNELKKSGSNGGANEPSTKGSNGTQKEVSAGKSRRINERALSGKNSDGSLYKGKNKFRDGYGNAKVSKADRDSDSGETVRENCSEDGVWTPERSALHQEITDKMFEGKKPADGQTTYTFMGGGPSSGKSYVVNNQREALGIPEASDSVVLNPDTIKEYLPEYDPKNPSPVHEESSALNKTVGNIARENGYNVLDDGTGDGSVEKMKKKIADARESGSRVNAVYVTTPIEKALEGNAKRERSVKEDLLIKTHQKVSEIFPQIASDFDDCSLWYNPLVKGEPIVQIAKCTRGGEIEVLDKKLWDDFIAKKDWKRNDSRDDEDDTKKGNKMKEQKNVNKEGKKYYTKEELAHWEERNMPTPRQYRIIMAVQNDRIESVEELDFIPTDEEIEYFKDTKRWYDETEQKTGKRPVFCYVAE